MIKTFATGALLMTTAACAVVPPASEAEQAGQAPAAAGGICKADAARSLTGRQASGELGTEALRLSGATALRWIRPGDVVTMDYREDRVNIELDSNSRVQLIRCG